MVSVRTTTKVLIMSDLHAPHQDERALKVVEAVQSYEQPTLTIALGDWIDASAVSTFPHDIDQFDQLHEFEVGNDLLDRFKPSVYLAGNHEHRFVRPGCVPQDYRRLLDPVRWLNIKQRKIKWIPYSRFPTDIYRIGDLSFVHGFSCAKYAATKHAERFGSVVFGHTHRVQMVTVPHYNHFWRGYNIGCLCDKDQRYTATWDPPGWTSACGLATVYRSGHFTFETIIIEGDKVHVAGQEYKIAA